MMIRVLGILKVFVHVEGVIYPGVRGGHVVSLFVGRVKFLLTEGDSTGSFGKKSQISLFGEILK